MEKNGKRIGVGAMFALIFFSIVFLSNNCFAQIGEVAPVVRGPYLQKLQTNDNGLASVTVRWRVEALSIEGSAILDNGSYRVCYQRSPSGFVQCVSAGKQISSKYVEYRDKLGYNHNGFDYQASLESLQAGSQYQYWIESQDCLEKSCPRPSGYFETPPMKGASFTSEDPLKVWVLGDSGSDYYCNTTPNCETETVRDAYLKYSGDYDDQIEEGNSPYFYDETDVMIMLGDNAYGTTTTNSTVTAYEGGSDIAHQEKLFRKYKKMLRYKSVWPTVGNHEVDHGHGEDFYKIFSTTSETNFASSDNTETFSRAYYSFDHGNVHFISLNSEIDSDADPDPATTTEMARWLKSDIESAKENDTRWIIVYFHHPVYTSGRHPENEPDSKAMRDSILPILDEQKVDLVLAGHNHHYERSYLVKGFHHKNVGDCEDSYQDCWFKQNNNGSLVFQKCYFDEFIGNDGGFEAACDEQASCNSTPAFSYSGMVHGYPFLASPESGGYWSDPISNFPGYLDGSAGILDYGYTDDIYEKDVNGDGTVYVVAGNASKVTNYPMEGYNCWGALDEEYYFHHPLMKQFRNGYTGYEYYDDRDGGRGLQELGSVALEITDDKLEMRFIGLDDNDEPIILDRFMICKTGYCNWSGGRPEGSNADLAGLDDLTNVASDFKVFPTMVYNSVNVAWENPPVESMNQGVVMRVWDMKGNLQVERTLDIDGALNWNIDMSGFAKGMYVVELESNEQVKHTKIVKM